MGVPTSIELYDGIGRISCISKNRYYDVIACPHTQDFLDEKCLEEKKECKIYHGMNWVAGHELLLVLVECGKLVEISEKKWFFYSVNNYLTGGLLW